MQVAIIKYNAGNIQSVSYGLERLGVDFIITDQIEAIQKSDKVIFPGVGEASATMQYLKSKNLNEVIKNLKQPVLGICLGMQLMCSYSEENNTTCLGIFDEDVKRFTPTPDKKVPHIGWNQLRSVNEWLSGELEREHVYFVHSFYVPINTYTSAVTDYSVTFSAAMRKNNFYAVQFHPEKSARAGGLVLEKFLRL